MLDNEDEKKRPHPCLVNAMVLMAVDIVSAFPVEDVSRVIGPRVVEFQIPQNTPSSEQLLAATQAHCSQSLANADRLLDYIKAELLLAFWYLRNGRLSEAYYTMASANR
jgi:hypothetical protein